MAEKLREPQLEPALAPPQAQLLLPSLEMPLLQEPQPELALALPQAQLPRPRALPRPRRL